MSFPTYRSCILYCLMSIISIRNSFWLQNYLAGNLQICLIIFAGSNNTRLCRYKTILLSFCLQSRLPSWLESGWSENVIISGPVSQQHIYHGISSRLYKWQILQVVIGIQIIFILNLNRNLNELLEINCSILDLDKYIRSIQFENF